VRAADGFTDLQTARCVRQLAGTVAPGDAVRFDGAVADVPASWADNAVLLSASMYESFGLNIGEAMAVGAFPVEYDFPASDRLWPGAWLFARIEPAVARIRSARPGLYRDWINEFYSFDRQSRSMLDLLPRL
jgi:hypothetical protein